LTFVLLICARPEYFVAPGSCPKLTQLFWAASDCTTARTPASSKTHRVFVMAVLMRIVWRSVRDPGVQGHQVNRGDTVNLKGVAAQASPAAGPDFTREIERPSILERMTGSTTDSSRG